MTLRDRVSALLAEYGIPSAAVGVLRDGEITEFAVGVKNVETGEPATTDTVYQLGSMTKTWTALAFLQFAKARTHIALDAPIVQAMPVFCRHHCLISCRHQCLL